MILFLGFTITFILVRLPAIVDEVSLFDLFANSGIRCSECYYEWLQTLADEFGIVENPNFFNWIEMYWLYWVNALKWNYGKSYLFLTEVSALIIGRLQHTVLLLTSSIFVALILTVINERKFIGEKKYQVIIKGAILAAIPIFLFTALILFTFELFAFDLSGTITYEIWVDAKNEPLGGLIIATDLICHMIIPSIGIGILIFGFGLKNGVRFGVPPPTSDVLVESYEESVKQSISQHHLRKLLNQFISGIKKNIGFIFSTLIIVEVATGWYGLGNLLLRSVTMGDPPVLQGVLNSFIVIVALLYLVLEFISYALSSYSSRGLSKNITSK